MGFRLALFIVLAFVVVVTSAIFFFVNITIFCENRNEIDFIVFRIDCTTVPNKQAQLAITFDKACTMFRTDYNCDLGYIKSVGLVYSEFGQQPKNYTLTELCRLKNPYLIDRQCAKLCGCDV